MSNQEEFNIAALTIIIAVACFTVGYHLGKKMVTDKPCAILGVKK